MGYEHELKFHIRDAAAMRETLRAAGASFESEAFEINSMFDTSDRALRRRGCGLRVRRARVVGADTEIATLTFKGPVEASSVKSRQEIETRLADAAGMCTILDKIGLIEIVLYEKRRETWRLDGCEIVLDELPQLGWWLEIEAATPAAVQTMRTQLNLTDTPPSEKTYIQMAVEHVAAKHVAAEHGAAAANGRVALLFDESNA